VNRNIILVGVAVVIAVLVILFFLMREGEEGQERVAGSDQADTTLAAGETAVPEVPQDPSPEAGIGSEVAAQPAGQPEAPEEAQKPIQEEIRAEAQPETPEAIEQLATAPAESPASTTDGDTAKSDAPAPSFDVVRVERSGESVIAGRAEKGSEVTVYDGEEPLGSAEVDASGAWVLVPERPLAPGDHEITLRAKTETGEERESEEVAVIVVPEAKGETSPSDVALGETPKAQESQGAPPQDGQADQIVQGALGAGEAAEPPAEQPLVVLLPRSGEGATRVLQQPGEGISQGTLVLETIDYDQDGMAIIAGRAPTGSRLVVYLDNQALDAITASDVGRWRLRVEIRISPGLHSLRVDQVDAGGTVIARVETPFSRAEAAVIAASDARVIVQPGNSLWRIARRTYGEGLLYTVIYESNRDQIVDPDLIYPGQIFELPQSN
jgi:nucleoid-associated protein YgaU